MQELNQEFEISPELLCDINRATIIKQILMNSLWKCAHDIEELRRKLKIKYPDLLTVLDDPNL